MPSPLRTYRPVAGAPFRIGRDHQCELILRDSAVSRQHGSLSWNPESGWLYENHSTTSGTWIGEEKVSTRKLQDGDILQLGVQQLRFILQGEELTILHIAPNTALPPVELDEQKPLTLGRSDASLILEHPNCPRILAKAIRRQDDCVLRWTVPVYNEVDKRQRTSRLIPGSLLHLPWGTLFYRNGRLALHPQGNGLSVSIRKLSVIRGDRTLLDNISLELEPGTLLSVIGLSGQGKSTFLRALVSGQHPAQGSIFYNKTPHHLISVQSSVAFLPQEPLLRNFLTVQETLEDAARLRLPADHHHAEKQERIQALLALVGLEHRKDTRAEVLSGGERRRLALAAQLMGGPGLLLLDEPLSGLDPVNAARLCTHLRQLAWLGHTIILTTHSYAALDVSDQVLVLHQGAQAFWGNRDQAYQYFQARDAEALLNTLRHRTGNDWSTLYRQSRHGHPEAEEIPLTQPASEPTLTPRAPRPAALPRLLQLEIRQYLRDRGRLAALTLQPLIIGLLLAQVFQPGASLWAASFALLLCANWFSLSLSIRTIVAERQLLADESRTGGSTSALLLAKAFFPVVLALAQTLGCWMLFGPSLGVPVNPWLVPILATTIFPAVATGITASALCHNTGQANAALPLLILPQVALAGALAPLDQMAAPGRYLAELLWSSHTQKLLQDHMTRTAPSPDSFLLPVATALGIFIIDGFILARLRKKQ